MKRFLSICTIAAAVAAAPSVQADDDYRIRRSAKNVIVMVPDGCHTSIQTLARWFKGEPLQLDSMTAGTVQTHMANSVITGSAAAATAFATGEKTTARFLGVAPRHEDLLTGYVPPADKEPYEPMATVLEAAKMKGIATGLISTSRITHATPAAYAAHIHDRGMDNEIMEHMVYQDVDVVFGGGKRHLLPKSEGGKRTDGENLVNVLVDRGYQFVETKDELETLESGKAWGMFASSHMTADIDRQFIAPTQPSIAEMTSKAIELLSQDEDGFLLMVEGSQIDWAGHANDSIYMVTDMVAFDDAVKVAVDFAEMDGNTVVIAFPDHNTGALSIGSGTAKMSYTATKVEDVVGPLMGMQFTSGVLVGKIGDDKSAQNIMANIQEGWGLTISQEDADEIVARSERMSLSNAINEVISERYTVFGWTTHGHTAEDVPVYTYGMNRKVGTLDNTELALITADKLNVNLDKADEKLFIDVAEEFAADEWELDLETDPENPVLKIKDAILPVSKDLVIQGDETTEMEGIVVYAPMSGKVYIPKEAVAIINGEDDDDVEECPWPWPWLCEYYARNK